MRLNLCLCLTAAVAISSVCVAISSVCIGSAARAQNAKDATKHLKNRPTKQHPQIQKAAAPRPSGENSGASPKDGNRSPNGAPVSNDAAIIAALERLTTQTAQQTAALERLTTQTAQQTAALQSIADSLRQLPLGGGDGTGGTSRSPRADLLVPPPTVICHTAVTVAPEADQAQQVVIGFLRLVNGAYEYANRYNSPSYSATYDAHTGALLNVTAGVEKGENLSCPSFLD